MRLSTAPTLAELQRRFQAGILSAIGTAPEFVTDVPTESAQARFQIYRDAYRLRLTEALAADFPALQRLLGEEVFAELAGRYAEAKPPWHYSIRWAGAGLAEFLRDRPDLSDMAAFEWALSTAFDASDAIPLQAEALAALPAEAWPDLRLVFHPSLRCIVLRHNAPELWHAITENKPPPDLTEENEPRDWLVWRRQFAVYYRPLDDREAWALDAARHGAAFSDWCEGLALWSDSENHPSAMAAGLLRRWLDDGLIVAVNSGGHG